MSHPEQGSERRTPELAGLLRPIQSMARLANVVISAVAMRGWLQAILIVLPVLHLLLGLPTREFRIEIDGSEAKHYLGHAYTLRVRQPSRLWQIPVDNQQNTTASTLRLYENGQPIGRPHTSHTEIAATRGGAYSHWHKILVFTPSDNSDPRINGRRYHAVATAVLAAPLRWFLLIALYGGAALGALTIAMSVLGDSASSIRKASQAGAVRYSRVGHSLLRAVADRPWLQAGLIAVPMAQALLGLPTKEYRFELDGSKAQHVIGHAYVWPLPQPSKVWDIPTGTAGHPPKYSLRLLENGRRSERSNVQLSDIASKPGGAYSYWDNKLFFTPHDNSDPRTNGHQYRAVATAQLAAPIRWALTVITGALGALGALGFIMSQRGDPNQSIGGRLASVQRHIAATFRTGVMRDVVGVSLPFVPIALGLSLLVAPYLSVDSQVLAAGSIGDFLIPHFSPLYPFFTRSVNYIVESMLWPIRWQGPSGLHAPTYSGASLRLIMLLQHALTIVSVAYLAVTVARSYRNRVLVAALLYFQPCMLVFTHSIWTEGPSFALLCAATAELIRFSRLDGTHGSALIRFYLIVGIASLIKHIFIVFAGMPLGCLLLMLLDRRKRAALLNGSPAIELRRVLVGLAAVLVTSQIVTNSTMRMLGIEPRSALGRAFLYRVSPGYLLENKTGSDQFFRGEAERRAILEDLRRKAKNEDLRQVLTIIEHTPNPWVEPWNAVEKYVRTQCEAALCDGHPWAATDKLLNSAAVHTILTLDGRLWRDVLMRTLQFLSPVLLDYDGAMADLRMSLANHRWLTTLNETVTGLNSSAIAGYPFQFGRDLGTMISLTTPLRHWASLLAIFAVIVAALRTGALPIIPATLFSSGMAYALFSSTVTVYNGRYGDLVGLMSVLAIVMAVIELRAGRRIEVSESSPGGQSHS